MRYTEQPGHRELPRRICIHTHLAFPQPDTCRLNPTPVETWPHKHQTRTDVGAVL